MSFVSGMRCPTVPNSFSYLSGLKLSRMTSGLIITQPGLILTGWSRPVDVGIICNLLVELEKFSATSYIWLGTAELPVF